MTLHFDQLLERVIKRDASELRIQPGYPARIYLDNQLIPITSEPLSDDAVKSYIRLIAPNEDLLEFARTGDVHFRFEFGPDHPFSVQLFTRDNRPVLVIRREYQVGQFRYP